VSTDPTDDANDAVLLAGLEGLIKAVREIRDYVNEARIKSELMADRARYISACSSMDILADTSEALQTYLAEPNGASRGHGYLFAFGVLQALYVQQDAAFWLLQGIRHPPDVATFSSAGAWIRKKTGLNDIRDLRNWSIGHPSRSDKGPFKGASFIVQHSVDVRGFQLFGYSDSGSADQRRHIDLRTLIGQQTSELTTLLTTALQDAHETERTHRKKFMDERLQSLFDNLHYPLEKLSEATRAKPEERGLGMYGIESVERAVVDFRERLRARNEPINAGLGLICDRLAVAMASLRTFFQGGEGVTPDMADVLAEFVADRVDELGRWAAEIDQEYRDQS
jgi:hypothetical protein